MKGIRLGWTVYKQYNCLFKSDFGVNFCYHVKQSPGVSCIWDVSCYLWAVP